MRRFLLTLFAVMLCVLLSRIAVAGDPHAHYKLHVQQIPSVQVAQPYVVQYVYGYSIQPRVVVTPISVNPSPTWVAKSYGVLPWNRVRVYYQVQ